jgi:dTDP-4-amino-4,6-dideoxygalactose transaminase
MDLPALLGGRPVRPEGPPAWPILDAEVVEAAQRALRDGSWGLYRGPNAEALEQALQRFFGIDHVLLCGSGTFAVELGLRALQVGPGDEVICASYDYPGNLLCVHAVGAVPVLVDVNPEDWNLAVPAVAAAMAAATKAIIASHLHGGAIAMRELCDLARGRGVLVLEDAAQCPGALVQGKLAGTWGDAGVVSFGGSKLLSAGRGGALLSRRPDVHQRARTHWLRGNVVAPLSELQAAVLVPQIAKLAERHRRRLASVQRLIGWLESVPGLRPFASSLPETQPGYYKLGLQLDERAFGLDRDRFVAALRGEGIAMSAGFAAQHVGRSPKRYRKGSSLAESERAHSGTVILHHPVLLGSDEELRQVADAVHKVHAHAARLRDPALEIAPPARLELGEPDR